MGSNLKFEYVTHTPSWKHVVCLSKYKTPHSRGFLWDKCLACLPILGCEKEGDFQGYRPPYNPKC